MGQNLEYLRNYQMFASVKQMDYAVMQYNKELSRAHYETLNAIKQYSCKIAGVCHLKYKTLARVLGKSERTIMRHIKYLVAKGCLSKITTVRPKKGGDGANIFVINPPNTNVEEKLNRRVSQKKSNQNNQDKRSYFKRLSDNVEQAIANINDKYFRSRPFNVPEHIYAIHKAVFTDRKLELIAEQCIAEALRLGVNSKTEQDDLLHYALKAVTKAKREYYRGERQDKIKSERYYAKKVVTNRVEKLREYQSESEYLDYPEQQQIESIELTPKWLLDQIEAEKRAASEPIKQKKYDEAELEKERERVRKMLQESY